MIYDSGDEEEDDEFEKDLQSKFQMMEQDGVSADEEMSEEDDDENYNEYVNLLESSIGQQSNEEIRQLLEEAKLHSMSLTNELLSTFTTSINELKDEAEIKISSVTTDNVISEPETCAFQSTNKADEHELKMKEQEERQKSKEMERQNQMKLEKERREKERLERERQFQEKMRQKQIEMQKKQKEHEEQMKQLEESTKRAEQLLITQQLETEKKKQEIQMKIDEERKQKLEAEKKRILDEKKRKEAERQKAEQERLEREALERKRKEEHLQQLERERKEKEERERKERQKKELEKSRLEEALRLFSSQKVVYEKVTKMKFLNKHERPKLSEISSQISTNELFTRLKEWQKKQNSLRSSFYSHSTACPTDNTILNNTEGVTKENGSELVLDEEVITHNYPNSELEDIVSMTIVSHDIAKLDSETLAKCKSLRLLNLNKHHISTLSKCFSHVKSLEFLLLRQNNLESLDGLSSLKSSLVDLTVDQNRIQDISPLGECTNLVVAQLANNSIQSIEPITRLKYLTQVNLYRNNVSSIPDLSELHYLLNFDIGRNGLTVVEPKSFQHCYILEDLMLYENRLVDFPVLQNGMLRNLYLGGNKLMQLPTQSIYAPLLVTLKVASNAIDNLESFASCPMLSTLDLSFNHISSLSDLLSLKHCKRLERILLNENPVTFKPDYRECLIAILPKIVDIDTVPVTEQEKALVYDYRLRHSPTLVANLSAKLYRRWIMKDDNPFESEFMDEYEYMCWHHSSFRLKFKSYNNEIRVEKSQEENQKYLDYYLDQKKQQLKMERDFKTVQYQQHLNFEYGSYQNIFMENEVIKQDKAARIIQRFCSSRRSNRRHKAAVKIQALWRGYYFREHKLNEILGPLRIRMQAATTIQRYWRGYYIRKLLKLARTVDDVELEVPAFDFEEEERFAESSTNFSVPRKVHRVYYYDRDNLYAVPEQEVTEPQEHEHVKLPPIQRDSWLSSQNKENLESPREGSSHSSRASRARASSDSVLSNYERQEQTVQKEKHGKIEQVRSDWNFQSEKVAKAFLKSKLRKPKNRKEKKKPAVFANVPSKYMSQAAIAAKQKQQQLIQQEEMMEIESVSSSRSSTASVKLPSLHKR